MKRYIKSSIILLAVLALVGCSKTEDVQSNPDSALQIESVSGISPFALTTKAVITGNTLPDSDAAIGVGIFVTASNGGAYDGHANGYTNVKFSNSGSGWSTSNPVYLSDTEGELYGYFPYSGTANDLSAIPVESSLNGTDYLYAKSQTVSHSYKSVSLTMNHALSCLHLTIKKGANFTAEAPLSKITLTSTAIDVTGTMDLTDGTITPSKKSGETGTVELTTDGTITAEGIEKDILLVPADNSNGKKGISISLMIAGKPAGITIPADNGLDIRSGIQNNLTLTVEDTGIKVTGIGVGEWGEGFAQQVQVGAHTVTVKLADEQNIEKDIFMMAYKDGDVVKIEAFAKSGKILGYTISGSATCNRTKTDKIYAFAISGISSNVTLEIGYKVAVEKLTLDRTSVNPAKGWAVHLVPELSPADATIKDVIWSSNNPDIATVDVRGNVTAIAQGEATITATAKGGSGVAASCNITVGPAIANSLSGEFSVSATKKVHFSKGNLWADASDDELNPVLHFEENQWGFNSSNNFLQYKKHVSRFTWHESLSGAVQKSCGKINFFCDEDHKVSADGSDKVYYLPSYEEWQYLFSNGQNKCVVTVCGQKNCVVLLPDNWVWNANTVGNKWQNGYPETSENGEVTWKTMEDAGAVCLPPAGFRMETKFSWLGENGYYWTSTPSSGNSSWFFLCANNVQFSGGYEEARIASYAVRLVTNEE